MEFVPDCDTLRLLHPPAGHRDGAVRPRLARPRARAPVAAHDPAGTRSTGSPTQGMAALAGTELEFIAFDTPYEDARRPGLARPDAANQYNVDYSLLGTTRVEPLLRDIRNHMYAAGLDVEGAKGECNFGQHEIGFLYDDAWSPPTTTASTRPPPRRSPPSTASRSPSWPSSTSARATPATSTCRCAATRRRRRVLGRRTSARRSTTSSSPACWRRCATSRCCTRRTSTPTSGSRAGSFAPTAIALGPRQPHLRGAARRPRRQRADGEPAARRRRQPVPRARRHAGRRPARHRATSWRSRTRWSATPTTPTSSTCRPRCGRPATPFAASDIARAAFGDEVVDHYINMADVELAAFDAAVTDWELAPRLRAAVTAGT